MQKYGASCLLLSAKLWVLATRSFLRHIVISIMPRVLCFYFYYFTPFIMATKRNARPLFEPLNKTPFLLSRSYFNFKSVLLTALLMQAFLLASVCVGVCFEGSFSGNWNVIQNSWLEKEIVFAERTLRQQSKFFFVLLQALVTSVTSRANPCWRWLSSRKRYAYYWGVCSFHLVSERC